MTHKKTDADFPKSMKWSRVFYRACKIREERKKQGQIIDGEIAHKLALNEIEIEDANGKPELKFTF